MKLHKTWMGSPNPLVCCSSNGRSVASEADKLSYARASFCSSFSTSPCDDGTMQVAIAMTEKETGAVVCTNERMPLLKTTLLKVQGCLCHDDDDDDDAKKKNRKSIHNAMQCNHLTFMPRPLRHSLHRRRSAACRRRTSAKSKRLMS